jgi:hypothetical protein
MMREIFAAAIPLRQMMREKSAAKVEGRIGDGRPLRPRHGIIAFEEG